MQKLCFFYAKIVFFYTKNEFFLQNEFNLCIIKTNMTEIPSYIIRHYDFSHIKFRRKFQ